MNKFSKVIKNILGRFWLLFWLDSWLVLGLIYIYSALIYRVCDTYMDNLYRQTAVVYPSLLSAGIPYRVLLKKLSPTKNAYKNLEDLSIGLGSLDLTAQLLYMYDIVSIYNTPSALYTSVKCLTPACALFRLKGNKLYTNVDFATTKVKTVIHTQSDSIFLCYLLWGISDFVFPLVDNFSAIAKVPSSWAVLYPGAILDAWKIRQFGATATNVQDLLSKVCLCPVARLTGVVTAILNNIVYINDVPHKCWSSDAILVGLHSRVSKGDPICSYVVYRGVPDPDKILRVYSGVTPPLSVVPYIPVKTSAGVLHALNTLKIVYNNVLPLAGDALTIQRYTTTCRLRNTMLLVPYAELPARVNPMQFLLLTVWRSAGVLIVIPAGRNQRDMLIALSCVLLNIPVGTICIVYQLLSIVLPIQLNLVAQNLILAYYTLTLKESLRREVNEWV